MSFLSTAFLSADPLLADVTVDESVKEGPLPHLQNGIEVEGAEIAKWPAEVKYTTYPPDAYTQLAGTMISNLEVTQEAGSPFTSKVVGQVFNIPVKDGDQMLDEVFITASTGFQSGSGGTYHIRLVDLGNYAVTDGYEEGKSLFAGDPSFTLGVRPSEDSTFARVFSLQFKGKDRVRMQAGHWYVFELIADTANSGQQSLKWFRSGTRDIANSTMPDARLFTVGTTPESKVTDRRVEMKDRQAYIGLRTSKAP